MAANSAVETIVAVRFVGAPAMVARAIRDATRQLDPQLLTEAQTLNALTETQGERLKPVTVDGVIASFLALVLAVIGVYGVISFSVSQQAREIGIRIALGAQYRDVMILISRPGAMPVILGLAIGSPASRRATN